MTHRERALSESELAQRILVVSAVIHRRWRGRLYGYTPYVREVDAWSHLFNEVRIIGPVIDGPPPDDCAPFSSENVAIVDVPATGGDTLVAKAAQALRVPLLALHLIRQMNWADAIQVRSPSNLGVVALPLAPLFSQRLHCKYAGMWGAFDGEPFSSRFQRRILVSSWWRGPVSVYGPASTDPPKVHDSFSTALTKAQLAVPRPTDDRPAGSPARVLFVGRLSEAKNVDAVIRAVTNLEQSGVRCTLEVIGDGPMRAALEALVAETELGDAVTFRGALPVDEVLSAYRRSDFLALVSESEGWPKVIVEAMAFGVVVIGNDRGLVPRIVEDGRGYSIPPGDAQSLARVITDLVGDPQVRRLVADRASTWARPFSLEYFADDLRRLLDESWPSSKANSADQQGSDPS